MDTAFSELRAAAVSIAAACGLTGRSRATHYRRVDPAGVALGPRHGPWLPRRLPPSTITDEQRERVLRLLASPDYRDLAIPQVWARELDEDRYWCSESSMYRIARRRRAEPGTTRAGHPSGAGPPRAGRSWPERGVVLGYHRVERPRKGEWYKLYVVLDIFSRYVPGWLVANAEDAVVAKDFLASA